MAHSKEPEKKQEPKQEQGIAMLWSNEDLLNILRLCEVGITDAERSSNLYGNVDLIPVRHAISVIQAKANLELQARSEQKASAPTPKAPEKPPEKTKGK